MTGRQCLAAFLSGNPGSRAPNVPLPAGLAARIGGISQQAMTSSPSEWVNALSSCADLLDADAIVVGFDHTLVAEALGGRIEWTDDLPSVVSVPMGVPATVVPGSRLDAAVETAARLFPLLGDRRGAIVAMTGPLTLATQLFGSPALDRLGELRTPLGQVVENFCKTRPQLLMLMERGLGAETIGKPQQRAYNTLRNIAAHFAVPLGIYLEGWRPAMLESLAVLGLDAYLLGPGEADARPSPEALEPLCRKVRSLGVPGISPGFDPGAWAGIHSPKLMYLTPGALGADADIESVRRQINTLKG